MLPLTSRSLKNSFTIIACLLIIGFTHTEATGQKIKYEDLFNDLPNITNEQAYYRFLRYQKQDPYLENTYVQLGNLSEAIFNELDPFRNIESVKHWTQNAILYYQLFAVYLQDGNVRRHRSFYDNIPIIASGRRLNNEDVLAYIEERLSFCQNFQDSLMLTYNALEKAKGHYNNCVRIFNQINADYYNLKEALLQTDDRLMSEINLLNNEFDASLDAFKEYQYLLRRFPVRGYNQISILHPIETFRLDGITNSDFLQDTVDLWDYGSWVQQFTNIYNQQILVLRNEIDQIQKRFDNNVQKLLNNVPLDPEMTLHSYDQLFLFRLGVYDNNSLVRELFSYLEERQHFLHLSKDLVNNATDSTPELMNRKLRYYYRMSEQLMLCKDKIQSLYATINHQRVRRFRTFFDTHYQGEQGLRSFCHEQQHVVSSVFDEAMLNLKSYLLHEAMNRDSIVVSFAPGVIGIPRKPFMDDSDNENQHTHFLNEVFYLQHQPSYVSGHLKRQDRNIAFVAKVSISDNIQVDWFKEIGSLVDGSLNYNTHTEKIFAYEDGILALMMSYPPEYTNRQASNDDPQDGQQYQLPKNLTLVHLDHTGNIIFSKDLESKKQPVYIHYDDINKLIRMAFVARLNNDPIDYGDITICLADSSGNVIWETPLGVRGILTDIIRTENHFMAFINTRKNDMPGSLTNHNNRDNHWGWQYVDISPEGHVMRTIPTMIERSVYLDKVFSISSDKINLIGYTGNPGDKSGALQYMIVSSEGDMLFPTFD